MSFTHLTAQNRVCIFHQKCVHFSNAEIARRIGRHRSSIGREMYRFRRHPSWPYYKQYLPDAADVMAREHRAKPRGARWVKHRPLLAYVLRKLRAEWSPQQIAGRLPRDFPDDLEMRVSHQTIYSYIAADRKGGGSLHKRLRRSCSLISRMGFIWMSGGGFIFVIVLMGGCCGLRSEIRDLPRRSRGRGEYGEKTLRKCRTALWIRFNVLHAVDARPGRGSGLG